MNIFHLLVKMTRIPLSRGSKQPIVQHRHIDQPLPLPLPLDEPVPQPIAAELQPAALQRPLVLGTDVGLVFGVCAARVVQIVQPQVHGQRDGLQATLEHLAGREVNRGKGERGDGRARWGQQREGE